MSKVRALYEDKVERRTQVLIAAGLDEEEAHRIATDADHRDRGDHMAALADEASKRREGGAP